MQGSIGRGMSLSSNYMQHLLCSRFIVLSVQQKCKIHKKSVYEQLNLPPKPKRPLSPFFTYLKEIRPALGKEFPDLKAKDLVKTAAQRWNNDDSKLKETLIKQYKEEMEDYSKIKDEYDKHLTPEQKTEIKKAKLHAQDIKTEKELKKKPKMFGKPKMPMSIFLRYLDKKRSEQNKYSSYKEWFINTSNEWKTVSNELKTQLEKERQHELEKWYRDIKEWENKMIKEGHLDVVRSSSLRLLSQQTRKT